MAETGLTRRRLLKTTGYMAGALSLPFVHGAHAAGKLYWTAEYLGKFDGHWAALPVSTGSPTLPACARIDLLKAHAGLDITAMYPSNGSPNKQLTEAWDWENFLTAARKCFAAGYPFGLPLGVSPDSVDWVGAMFASYGAELVDREGRITVDSEPVKIVLD